MTNNDTAKLTVTELAYDPMRAHRAYQIVLASDFEAVCAERDRACGRVEALLAQRDSLAARVERLETDLKAAYHELGGIGKESSIQFHRIGIDSARGIIGRALSPQAEKEPQP